MNGEIVRVNSSRGTAFGSHNFNWTVSISFVNLITYTSDKSVYQIKNIDF